MNLEQNDDPVFAVALRLHTESTIPTLDISRLCWTGYASKPLFDGATWTGPGS